MKPISDEEFERRFDAGEDVMDFVDVSAATRPNQGMDGYVVPLDIPAGMLRGIDRAAERMGVSRQAVIKVWLAERLDEEASHEVRIALAGA